MFEVERCEERGTVPQGLEVLNKMTGSYILSIEVGAGGCSSGQSTSQITPGLRSAMLISKRSVSG